MDKKIKMTTVEGYAAEVVTCFINKALGPIAKYVVENYSNIGESTEDELISEFRKLVDVKPPTVGAPGIMGMAPDINKSKEGVKRTRTTKEEKSVWSTVEEFLAKTKDGEKLCSYYSTRASGDNKNKVCCNPVINPTCEKYNDWRCQTHKDKKSTIDKMINKDSGLNIDKSSIVPSLNAPNVTLPPMLPPMMGPVSSAVPPPLPPSIPGMMAPKPSTPKVPVAPVISSPVRVPKIATPPKEPEPVVETPEQLDLARVAGLDNKHLMAKNASLSGMVFEYDTTSSTPGIYLIGKLNITYADAAPADYMDKLTPLSADEQKILSKFPQLTGYKPVAPKIAPLPTLPGLPPLPQLG
jgi:hypothetical protein